jgi:hypothetical protein
MKEAVLRILKMRGEMILPNMAMRKLNPMMINY